MERMLHSLRQCPEFGSAPGVAMDVGVPSVLAVRYDGPTGSMLALTNLDEEAVVVDAGEVATGHAMEIFADDDYGDVDEDLRQVEVNGFGYRWIRTAWEIPTHPPPPVT